MTYATLMVHLELGRPNAGVLRVATDLAARFHSRVVGIAAGEPMMAMADDGCVSNSLVQKDVAYLEKEVDGIEADFRAAFRDRSNAVEWRSKIIFGPLASYLASEARCADLVLTAAVFHKTATETQRVDAGELVLRCGRPVLVVPPTVNGLKLGRVVVCWKDTREARRAVNDALPLLKQAGHVDVVEIVREDDVTAAGSRLDDVVAWLKLHGVPATAAAIAAYGDDKEQLAAIIEQRDDDLVVAGGYGHSRLREWVFGGVTRDLLAKGGCSLLSH